MCLVKSIIWCVPYLWFSIVQLHTALNRVMDKKQITPTLLIDVCYNFLCVLKTDLGLFCRDILVEILHTAGIMALLLVSVDPDIIKLVECQHSDEILHYLHTQARLPLHDFAERILHSGHYTLIPNNLVGISQLVPQQ